MKINRVFAVFFSPAGSTRDLTLTLANAIGDAPELIDFTRPSAREDSYAFREGDLVIFGMPTYAGKLPNKLLPFVQSGFAGNGALAVPLVTFGNRSFDNSLAELTASLKSDGFSVIGAGAFACRHVFSETLAADRPDADDRAKLASLGAGIVGKLSRDDLSEPAVPGDAAAPYYTPRGLDGEPKVFLKAKPVTDPDRCTRCGVCTALCPMGSIPAADPTATEGICIKCHACVRGCPEKARSFTDEAFLSHRAMLERDYTRRAETQIFF